MTSIPGADRSALEQAAERMVQLYAEWGKPEKAAEWRDRARLIAPFKRHTPPAGAGASQSTVSPSRSVWVRFSSMLMPFASCSLLWII